MKQFFKRLFCRHKYGIGINDDGLETIYERRCNKCKKVTQKIEKLKNPTIWYLAWVEQTKNK